MDLEDGGRRSRRGFAYQDAVTLLDCLELGSLFSEVRFEDADDIVCTGINDDFVVYRQVKTIEGGGRHSLASVSAPERAQRIETSILGRLFTGKPKDVREERFGLVLNVEPQNDLKGFYCDRYSRPSPTHDQRAAVCERLSELALPAGCSIAQRVDALEVIVESRTIEEVERLIVSKLKAPIAAHLGGQPLLQEVEDVLAQLSTEISRDAHAVAPKAWTTSSFAELLDRIVTQVTGRRTDGRMEPLPRLAKKLRVALLPAEEIQEHSDGLLRYRREQRASVGEGRKRFDTLNDEVFAATTKISARRRAGLLQDGPDAYSATLDSVSAVAIIVGVPQALALQALSDVTARCQHRYSDAN